METLIHADIFFFITSIAVVILTLCVIVAMVYVIRILRNVDHISARVKEESDQIIEDIKVLRSEVKDQGFKVFKIAAVYRFFKKLFDTRSRRKD